MSTITANAIKTKGRNRLKGFKMTADFKINATKDELLQTLNHLDEVVVQVMSEYAEKAQRIIVNQFEKTSVYARPSRRTGKLLNAINRHSISRLGNTVIAKVGDQTLLPFYWETQEKGRKAYTFQEKYVRVFRDGEPRLYTVRPARVGSLNTITANPGAEGTTNRYFSKRPNLKKVILTVSHPGVRARNFIRAGKSFIFSSLPQIQREIMSRAIPQKGPRKVSKLSADYFMGDF